MKASLAELGLGIGTALLSLLLVTGALLMSLSEGLPPAAPVEVSATFSGTIIGTEAPTSAFSLTPVPTLTCPLPLGWHTYTLLPGDSWEGLEAQYGLAVDQLQHGNCDLTGSLIAGWVVNVPPLPTPSPSPTATTTPTKEPEVRAPTDTPARFTSTAIAQGCVPRADWRGIYIVRAGDTLFQIGLRYNVVYTEIMRANCLTSEKIITGQRLAVPWVNTSTPLASATHTPRPTNPPAPTNTPPTPPTDVPSSTPVFTDTPENTPTPDTPSPYPYPYPPSP
jgi:LysM repeat protein